MDRRPTLEARPPALIDAVVRTLIPPASREHVMGDLWERYRSPLRFVLDAVKTMPFVIASRIRRTSTVGALVVQAFVLCVGLAAGSGGFVPAVAPLVVMLLTLVLRDAYKKSVSLSAKQVLADVAFGAGGMLASQAVLAATAPHLLMRVWGFAGGLVVLGMVYLIRLQNPGLGAFPRQVYAQRPATLDALVTEVRLYERMGRRAILIEALAGVVLALVFIVPLASSQNWFLRIGWALASAYGVYVAVFVSRHRPQPMPDGLGFVESLAHYRQELVRRQDLAHTLWRWYLLPFAPAMVFILSGSAMVAAGRGRPVWPAAVMVAIAVGIGAIVHAGSRDAARKLGVRIGALGSAEEQ